MAYAKAWSRSVHGWFRALNQSQARCLCFPRFYHYDILRGLRALVRYAELTGFEVPEESALRGADGEWAERGPAAVFPLVQAVLVIGDVCERAPDAGLLQDQGNVDTAHGKQALQLMRVIFFWRCLCS